jgi:3-dehydroquinate dehydratase/shikimate dehydrogenase
MQDSPSGRVNDPARPSTAPTTPPPLPQNSPGFPTPNNNADHPPHFHTPTSDLSQKQLAALNRLFAGDSESFICRTLKIDRKTLYNWKTHHPAFRAELARRNAEVWTGVVAEVRSTVIDAVTTLRRHLCAGTDMTQLRAARTLLTLVNSPRLAPTEPTTVTGVLDLLLRTTHPPTATPVTNASTPPTFTDAQRAALHQQLLAESAAIEHESDAARDARRKSPAAKPVPAPPAATALSPSPGTPGEGRGEGLSREPESATTHPVPRVAVAPEVHSLTPLDTPPPPTPPPSPLSSPTAYCLPSTDSSSMTYLCVPIFVSSLDQARRDAALAAEAGADIVEFRVDSLTDAADVHAVAADTTVRSIVTCRPPYEGGHSPLPEKDRLNLLRSAAESDAVYLDVELKAAPALSDVLSRPRDDRPGVILSAHDFTTRPDRLYNLLAEMTASPADVNKIVWTARTLRDNLEAFEILTARQKPTIALCMGEAGLISRVLAKKFGAFLTFASLTQGAETAPGQVSIHDMKRLYRWDAQNPTTKVYGVVGSPVAHSMSPALHNAAFDHVHHDGVYVPLLVNEGYESFKAFMETFLAFQPLHLSGLSITIPHKENALRYLQEKAAAIDPLAQSIGALNTIVVDHPSSLNPEPRTLNPLRGFSTDYSAILDSITSALNITRDDLKNYRVAVLGAGGTGRTAVAALAHYGATVVCYNRTRAKADALAAEFTGKTGRVVAADFAKIGDSCCQIFLNTTSVGMHPKVDASPLDGLDVTFTPDTLVFDTIYNPIETKLLKQAKAAGAKTVSGVEMFVRQAAAQFEAWTDKAAPTELMRRVVEDRLSKT